MAQTLPTPLPCPFCGSTPKLWSAGTPTVDYVGCKNKKCSVHPKHGTTAGHALAISSWNHRSERINGNELLLRAMILQVARFEPWTSGDTGEVCFGGLCYSVKIIDGLPHLDAHTSVCLAEAISALEGRQ